MEYTIFFEIKWTFCEEILNIKKLLAGCIKWYWLPMQQTHEWIMWSNKSSVTMTSSLLAEAEEDYRTHMGSFTTWNLLSWPCVSIHSSYQGHKASWRRPVQTTLSRACSEATSTCNAVSMTAVTLLAGRLIGSYMQQKTTDSLAAQKWDISQWIWIWPGELKCLWRLYKLPRQFMQRMWYLLGYHPVNRTALHTVQSLAI